MISPFQKFLRGLEAAQLDMNEVFNELRAFAEIMSNKKNSIELDENGFYYVTASGPIEDVIPTMQKQLEKLQRIKQQKDSV